MLKNDCVLELTVYNVGSMNRSNVHLRDLRRPELSAWETVLSDDHELGGVTVTAVAEEPLPEQRHTRYLLSLAGHSDPAPLWATTTTPTEVAFYRDVGPAIPRLLPHCWWQAEAAGEGWLLLDDVPAYRPPERWAADDVEKVIAMLASLHGTFWEERERLDGMDWLPQPWHAQPPQRAPGFLQAWQFWDKMTGGGAPLSHQAVRSTGGLAPLLIRAAAGLEVMRRLGGWPGVVERAHLMELTTLLDDPLPMLYPLRNLPITLLHGNPVPHHWRLTLLGERRLTDWRAVAAGPGIWDLVRLLEGAARLPSWPIDAETMIDSYLLRLHVGLASFDARAHRQALPAALCLYVITAWLPRLASWFQPYVYSPRTWASLLALEPEELVARGWGPVVAHRAYLSDLFRRFEQASRLL
jgi:hypothetical protein